MSEQAKLKGGGSGESSEVNQAPVFSVRYGNGRRFRDAFEVIEGSGAGPFVTVKVSRGDGLRVVETNSDRSILSILDLPPASFEELKGEGSASVELESLVRVLQRVRESDGIRVSTSESKLLVRYPESRRELSLPLTDRRKRRTPPPFSLEWDSSLEVGTRELQSVMKDLSDLGAGAVEVSLGRAGITFSQTAGGVEYEKRFGRDDDCVEEFSLSSDVKGGAGTEYDLARLKSIVSRRFKSLTLSLGAGKPAKAKYSLGDLGDELAVIIAPSS